MLLKLDEWFQMAYKKTTRKYQRTNTTIRFPITKQYDLIQSPFNTDPLFSSNKNTDPLNATAERLVIHLTHRPIFWEENKILFHMRPMPRLQQAQNAQNAVA
jgi:hypothetical protein